MKDFDTEVARIHRRHLLRKLLLTLFTVTALAAAALLGR